ncbi:MAG TPA: hypothetical protein VK560_01560, partial [Gemmatimonadaceae bacterium]|nr:hypothetical protein [Gemmatimonadaceae bacterium]
AKIRVAQEEIAKGNIGPAINQLNGILHTLDDMLKHGQVTPVQAAPLQSLVNRIIQSLSM